MKLHVLSDLHLGYASMERPLAECDAVVLAGDIGPPRLAVAWALRFDRPVLYVPGNHEFYGGTIDGVLAELDALCAGTHVHVLHDGEAVVGGVRFLGTTLWTDFNLFGDGDARQAAMESGCRLMRDFSRIRMADASPAPFTPDDAAACFSRHAAWLQHRLRATHDGPTVVITHHAPSVRSIHPRFADSPMNACFASDVEHLARDHAPALWIHGHTHDSFDYPLHGTRVLCNPRGYAKGGVNENARFDPQLVIEV
jgi:predicted phosphodiesterase